MLCNTSDATRRGAACNAPHRYRSCGLTIESEVALPALRPDSAEDAADIVIRHGKVLPGKEASAGYRRNQIFDVFRYEAVAGHSVTIEPLPGAAPANIADLIVSRVLTVLVYQRGLLPLHASAVATPAGLVAICGASGAGKSTLAAVLAHRGHLLAADDMLLAAHERTPPAAPAVKLTAASLDRVGRTADGLVLANQVERKFYLPLETPPPPALPIVRLVQLRVGTAAVAPLSTVEAAAGWRNCIRMPDLMEQAPDPKALWSQWLALLGRVENLAASHGGRMDVLDAIADRLDGTKAFVPNLCEAHG